MRLFHTIRHISAIQLYYQGWYRVKRKVLHINWYKKYLNVRLVFFETQTDRLLYVPESANIDGFFFTFLGLTHHFEEKVDWTFSKNGKLWNYNLQYLHYLLDDKILINQREELLKDISWELLSGRLLLEPYPVSLRIINTLLFLQRTGIRDIQIEQALLQQIDYLDHNLEYHLLANHLLENMYTLFIAAQYMNEKLLSKRYEKYLLKQLNEQILADGGHYECTPMYQSILLSKLLFCIEVAIQSPLVDEAFVNILRKTASKMVGWMQMYSFPDGSWALFNDAAERVAPTTQQVKEAANYLQIPIEEVVLKESGFSKCRGRDWELIVKTGKIQPAYQPGHAHADIGSFCLWYQGIQYIVDPGISTYAISEQRFWERSTSAHNTVAIGQINQSEVWSGFRVGRRAHVEIKARLENKISIVIKRYGGGVHLERSFFCEGKEIQIIDSIKTKRRQALINSKGSVLLNPSVIITKENDYELRAGRLMLIFDNEDFEICKTEMASQYNRLFSTYKIVYRIRQTGRIRLRFQ